MLIVILFALFSFCFVDNYTHTPAVKINSLYHVIITNVISVGISASCLSGRVLGHHQHCTCWKWTHRSGTYFCCCKSLNQWQYHNHTVLNKLINTVTLYSIQLDWSCWILENECVCFFLSVLYLALLINNLLNKYCIIIIDAHRVKQNVSLSTT